MREQKNRVIAALLILNLLLSAGIIAFLISDARRAADESKAPAEEWRTADKYTLYIGTNDQETYTQLIDIDQAEKIVNRICAKHVDGYTRLEAVGSWVDETGTQTKESTLVYVFYDVPWDDLTEIMDEVLVALDQKTILIEHENAESIYYDGTNLEAE